MKKDDLYLEDEKVKCRTQPGWELPLKDFVIAGIQAPDHTFKGGPIMGRGMFMPEFSSAMSDPETGQGGHPNVHYTTGAGGIVVEVDTPDRQDEGSQSGPGRGCGQGHQSRSDQAARSPAACCKAWPRCSMRICASTKKGGC